MSDNEHQHEQEEAMVPVSFENPKEGEVHLSVKASITIPGNSHPKAGYSGFARDHHGTGLWARYARFTCVRTTIYHAMDAIYQGLTHMKATRIWDRNLIVTSDCVRTIELIKGLKPIEPHEKYLEGLLKCIWSIRGDWELRYVPEVLLGPADYLARRALELDGIFDERVLRPEDFDPNLKDLIERDKLSTEDPFYVPASHLLEV